MRCVVTGAFGYSGKHIAHRLLTLGHSVSTLTNTTPPDGSHLAAICVEPLDFSRPDDLCRALHGAEVLFNTYWVRFNYARFSHGQAARNSAILFDCARRAGVRRVVHVSITNPELDSPLSYFRGKALVEQALHESGLSHAILRPAVLFGREDILINNIAWTLRRFPLFAIPGDGQYRLQPIHVDDLAALAVDSAERGGNLVINAIGPETFAYRELVGKIGEIIGFPRRLLSLPPALVYSAGATIGAWMRDVFITRDEIRGLMAGLLCVDAAPAGGTFLTAWARERATELGRSYASELGRRRAVRA